MDRKPLVMADCRIITDMDWKTVPSDRLFAEKGKKILLCGGQWDLKEYSGKTPDQTRCVMIRGEILIPENGRYLAGLGADWWFRFAVDGKTVMDTGGCYPPSDMDHQTILKLKKASIPSTSIFPGEGQALPCVFR